MQRLALRRLHWDKDTIITLVGRFVLGPVVMVAILMLTAKNMPVDEFKTFVIQAAAPALAVLPILASHGDGDVEFSTNVVTLSTILFVIVVPIVDTLLGFM